MLPDARRIDALRTASEAFLRDRLERMGVEPSGLSDFYVHKLHSGQVLDAQDLALAQALDGFHPDLPVVEIGSGICLLPAMMALSGRGMIAVEQNGARSAAQEAYVERVRDLFDLDLTHLKANFPACADRLPREAVLLFTNFAAPRSAEVRTATIEALRDFAHTVFDATLFIGEYYTPAEIEASLEGFRRAGLDPQPLPGLPADPGGSSRDYRVVQGV